MTRKKNGRPKNPESKRTRFIKARLTEEEYTALRNLWAALGLTESGFLRHKLLRPSSLSTRINTAEVLSHLNLLGTEIGRSGNNINQLARHANFLNKRGMLSPEIVLQFNVLFTAYISVFRDMEKSTRELLRLLKE